MRKILTRRIGVLITGILLISAGFIFNEWTLAYYLSDGKIESVWKRIIIWGFDISLIVIGFLILKKKFSLSFKNIFISAFSFLLTFIIAEYAFRLLYPAIYPVNQLFSKSELFEPKPYVMYGGKPNHEELNQFGYVENAPSKNKPINEFRVFILGGSTVYAGKPTISKLLENVFNDNGLSNVKCYNWGVPASTSGMELARIVFEIYDQEPDLIIMYNGGNDLLINLWADPRPGYPYNYFLYESNPLLEKDVGAYPMINLMLYESKLLRHFFPSYFIKVFTNYYQTRIDVNYGEESWKNEIVDTYVNNIIKSQNISKSIGSDFIVFFQPLVYFKDSLTKEEMEFMTNSGLKDHITTMRLKVFDKINVSKDTSDIHIVDLSNMFDGNSNEIFWDGFHTIQSSKNIIAQELFDQLVATYDTTNFQK